MTIQKINTEIRKEQIAQAALFLTGSNGWKDVSIASIAKHIGLVPSAVYRHFKNKEEILDAVINLIRDRLFGNLAVVYQETNDPIARLQSLLMRHVRLIRENQGIPRILFSDTIYENNPKRMARVYENIRSYLVKIAEIIRQGQKNGQIRNKNDPNTLSVMFLGLIQPAAILWHLSNGEFDVEKHAKKAWTIFIQTLKQNN